MSLPVFTVQQIAENIIATQQASFGETIPIFRRAFIRVNAWILAGVFILLYKYCGFMFLQQFVAYASMSPTTVNGKTIRPLVEWGRLIGAGDPAPAVAAEHKIAVSVLTVDPTKSLSSGKTLVNSRTNVVYAVVYDVALDASTIYATITPVSDQAGGDGSGTLGNMTVDDQLSFTSPPRNVSRVVTVTEQSVTGVDAQTADEYRRDITTAFQTKPQGGAYADYKLWALTVPGITHAYPYSGDVPGEIDVYVEADPIDAGNPDGIPTADQITAVANAIEFSDGGTPGVDLATRRPVNAAVNVHPIFRTPFDVKVYDFDGGPNSAKTLNDINTALQEYFFGCEPFIVGVATLPRLDRITQAAVSGIVEDVLNADGGGASKIELWIFGALTSSYQLGAHGEKARLGTVQYPTT